MPTAVITGASQGLGRGTARAWPGAAGPWWWMPVTPASSPPRGTGWPR